MIDKTIWKERLKNYVGEESAHRVGILKIIRILNGTHYYIVTQIIMFERESERERKKYSLFTLAINSVEWLEV